jgi:hypothetical protein
VSAGKRAGSRRAEKPKRSVSPPVLLHSLGITACVIAWGYLVYAAIDFGTNARAGTPSAWWLLALATLGAVACLFTGLMLVARLLRIMGITAAPRAAVPAQRTSSPESGELPVTITSVTPTVAPRSAGTPPASSREPSYAAAISDLTDVSAAPVTRRPPGHRRATR